MTSKEAYNVLLQAWQGNKEAENYPSFDDINEALYTIKQALERLEQLGKIFSDSHICEIKTRFNEIECSADKCDNCPLGFESGICLKNTFEKKWELQQENQELKEKVKTYEDLLHTIEDEVFGE